MHARIVESCLRHGFGWVHGILNSSSNPVMYGGESDVKFPQGGISCATTMSPTSRAMPGTSRAWPSWASRTKEQQKGYALTLDIHRRTIKCCTAGRTAGDIYQFVVDEFRKHGVEYPASLVGHSMGAWFHQQEPVLKSKVKSPCWKTA